MKEPSSEPHISPPERYDLQNQPRAPRLIMEISRLLHARVREGQTGGVMAQRTACMVLAHLVVRGGMDQQELIALTRLKPATVSILLGRMESEGYIERRSEPDDRRRLRVYPTAAGQAYDRAHLLRIFDSDRQALAGFDEAELATLEELLLRVRENLLGK